MSDVVDDPSVTRGRSSGPLILFLLVAIAIGIDLALDAGEGAETSHVLIEGAAMAFALAGAAWTWRRWRAERARARRALREAGREAARWQEEASRWRAEAEDVLRGLGEAIDEQFERWELTGAEREVGLLLLKGLSMKEVAEVRGTSERTTRQQARAVYRKGGLSGRAELSAFFLEDLLLPQRVPDGLTDPRPGPR